MDHDVFIAFSGIDWHFAIVIRDAHVAGNAMMPAIAQEARKSWSRPLINYLTIGQRKAEVQAFQVKSPPKRTLNLSSPPARE